MAFVEIVDIVLARITAAAPVGAVDGEIWFWPAVVAPIPVTILAAILLDNTPGAHVERNVGQAMIALEGETLTCQTSDVSTGGTVSYRISMKMTEFDAYLYHAPPKTRPEPEIDVQEAGPRPDPVM